jgi:protein tyrosine kinase modulator
MTGKRQLDVKECIAAIRRHAVHILGLGLLLALLALASSYLLTPRYTSRSLVQVAAQVLPSGYVKPIVTEHLRDRVATLEQRVLTRARLIPLVERTGLSREGGVERTVDQIRSNVAVTSAEPGSSPSSASKKKLLDRDDVPGLYIAFTWDNARQAQQVCSELTAMFLDENQKAREQVGQNTTDFLSRQLEQSKRNLDSLDSQLADFKKLHMGKLPTDVENNLKILTGLDSQLNASAQALNRAQQDKSFAESLLTQELAAYKSTQEAPNLPSLREQLITLQNQLVTLESRYTEEHPDVAKIKNDIAEIKFKLNDVRATADKGAATEDAPVKMEPPEILRLRERVHQEELAIERSEAEQTHLKSQIDSYQSRLALSPDIEEQYKKLTRDSETAHSIYAGLLANKTAAEMQTAMEHEQQGEQIKLLEGANLPDSPTFPVRWMFAVGGLVAGLALGISAVVAKEAVDRAVRNETDVADLLNLPTLAFVPYATSTAAGASGRPFRRWLSPQPAK